MRARRSSGNAQPVSTRTLVLARSPAALEPIPVGSWDWAKKAFAPTAFAPTVVTQTDTTKMARARTGCSGMVAVDGRAPVAVRVFGEAAARADRSAGRDHVGRH